MTLIDTRGLRRPTPPAGGLACLGALLLTSGAMAGEADLVLDTVRVTQAIRFVNTPLIANNPTMVRAIISHPDDVRAIRDVDALLHVFVDGVEADWSPVRSYNGPITSPLVQSEAVMNHHVNFLFVAPESADVDLTVVVNAGLLVPESNLDNNIMSVNDLVFECRDTVELVYVPVDYTPGGGVPDDALIDPGIGDGFLRAVFHPGAWDYHRSPLPPLRWTQDINSSATSLLNTLRDVRVNQLPAAGYGRPDLVYGWLRGNPYSGNGRAIGIPGDVAFGNTQTIRHQRTFAHEIGHLLDEGHNSERVGMIGIDVEHHLADTENLGQTHASTQNDIMVAGQLTNTAFVSNNTYVQTHGDARFACTAAADRDPVELLRVSGIYDHRTDTLTLDPVTYIERGTPDPDRPRGNAIVIFRDAQGNELGRTIADIGSTRSLCSDPANGVQLADTSPLHVLLPRRVDGVLVDRIDVMGAAPGVPLATAARTPAAPNVALTGIARRPDGGVQFLDAAPGARLTGRARVQWQGTDADGDELVHTLLYSRDGGSSWLPLAVNLRATSFEFDVRDVPASTDAGGRLRLVTSDGFNHRVVTSPPMEFAGVNAPETYLITPNDGDVFSRYGRVIFHGTSWDKEDLRIADAITWSSDIDGVFATGALVETTELSTGVHTITASAEDQDGNTDSASITIEILERLLADLDNDGAVAFSDILIVLSSWGPCESEFCPADFNGNGVVEFADLLFVLSNWT